MLSHRSLFSIRKIGVIAMAVLGLCHLHAQSATAATASEDQESIDQIWQKASSKYDAERAAVLQRVDSVANEGPFRTDWVLGFNMESLGRSSKSFSGHPTDSL